MKHVGIVFANTENADAMDYLKKSLENIFEEYVEFTLYYTELFQEDTVLHEDAYLMEHEVPFEYLRHHVSDYTAIFALERSFPKGSLEQILAIPENTDVLVVNDGTNSSKELVATLSYLNVGHINMTPLDFPLRNTHAYDDFSVAITTGAPQYVPKHIKNVIDVGIRQISFSTVYTLMRFLDLDVNVINRNLFRHIKTLVEPDTSYHDNYIFSYLKGEMLDHISNSGPYAMLLVDSRFRSVFANKKALSLLHASETRHINILDYVPKDLLEENETISAIISVNGINYHCDKYTFSIMDETIGYFILFQEENELELYSQQNVKKGYVARYQFRDIIHQSQVMDDLISKISKIAPTDFTVLLSGESGTGKELMAQSIHNGSFRNKEPFVAINCAALPENLLESELFGYEPGAFTGAREKGKVGLFEQANHGTIFLDEIGDISPKLQSQLLRVIQEKQIMRLGGDRLMDIDVRLITATNKDLAEAVKNGEFRQDLFFRLNVLAFHLPPLRNRREDIPLLLEHFMGPAYRSLSSEERRILLSYDWPGNIREIENVTAYYDALSSLPEYIYQNSFAMPDSRPANAAMSDHLEKTLLKLIEANTSLSHGIGRTAMLNFLHENELDISDSRLRKILSDLEKRGVLEIGKGRGGTMITEEGRNYLHRLL